MTYHKLASDVMIRFIALFSFLFVIAPHVYSETNPCSEHSCIAVIDAGSSGSRLHVFAYDQDDTSTPNHINEIWSKKITPGFATIEPNQNTVDTYLGTLFSGAPEQNMPVYFYATAGMRLVPQSRQKIYYQAVQNWFNRQSGWQLAAAKTITGNDEALYDWLAVNYYLGRLDSASRQQVGVMDIGGASVQIVFPIQKNSGVDDNSQVQINLYGKQINLFVHSFLGLGQNEMSHQLLDSNSCFADGYPLSDGTLGQGDAATCKRDVSFLINKIHKVKSIVQPVLASNPVDSWYAIGGFVNLAENKPFEFNDNQVNNQYFIQQADSLICHQPWENLSNQYPNNEYIDIYCLLPAFYYALMVDGYGLSANTPINYISGAQKLDWTTGVVLHH